METSRTPELPEILRILGSNISQSIFVARPGRVVKYDPTTQKADVKPLIQNPFTDREGNSKADAIPIITEVPVLFPRTSTYILTFPIVPGDNVLLIFCDRSIDDFMFSDGVIDTKPKDLRAHDLTDPVAIPGFFPFSKAIKDEISSGAVFGMQKGPQVRVAPAGVDVTTAGAPTGRSYVAMGDLVTAELAKIATAIGSLGGAYTPGLVMSTNLKAD